jgi:hypothetical protein
VIERLTELDLLLEILNLTVWATAQGERKLLQRRTRHKRLEPAEWVAEFRTPGYTRISGLKNMIRSVVSQKPTSFLDAVAALTVLYIYLTLAVSLRKHVHFPRSLFGSW